MNAAGDQKGGGGGDLLGIIAKSIILLLLVIPLVFAQPTDWFQAGLVKAELNVSSSIVLMPDGKSPVVEALHADIIFVPQSSEFTAVRNFRTFPKAAAGGDRVRFDWVNPSVGEISYGYSAVVEQANDVPRVAAKIPFPITVRGMDDYLAPTQHIDSADPAIALQAKSLVQGEDDLFVVVSKLAFWVKNNVEYNLSTLTAEVSQPASWVLKNKYGVCDELTSLFIAMLRSLNIPARFVSGLAFTSSSQFPEGWGAHGWAEVYFPGVGWIPFDPTFGEFGWVDPGHIKLKESLDPQEPTSVFEWRARDVDVGVNDLKLSAALLESTGVVASELKLSLHPIRDRVGFGSFNGIYLDVENLADYYVGSEISLNRVVDMEIVGSDSRQVVLPPRGRSRVFWKVKVAPNLDPNFQYDLPLIAYTIRNDSAKSSFAIGQYDVVFSSDDIDTSIDGLSLEEGDGLDLACAFEYDRIWESVGRLNCFVSNKGDVVLPVSVCYQGCEEFSLLPSQSKELFFDVPAPNAGPNEVKVIAKSGVLEKQAVLTLVRLDRPNIVIKDISLPGEVSYGDTFTLTFTLSRDSVSSPRAASVSIKGGGAKAVVDVGEVVADQIVAVNIRSEQLFSSNPVFDIVVSYEDPFGQSYSSESSASIVVSGVPWWKKFVGWFVVLF